MSGDARRTPTEDSLIQPRHPLVRVLRDVVEGVFCVIATLGGARNQVVSLLRRQGPPPRQAPLTPVRGARPAGALPEGTDAPAPDSPELAADGRARALTVISAIRQDWAPYPTWPLRRVPAPDWAWPLYPLFLAYSKIDAFHDSLRKLRFIHYAHWAVVKRIAGKGGAPERLRYKYLLFEVNFDGLMEQYVDGLTRLPLEKGLDTFRWIWGSSFGFPGSLPMPGFKRYIERNAYRPDYYWSAYPDATTTMVHAACTLREPLRALKAAAADDTVTDKEFDRRYREFLIEYQYHL